MEFPGELPRPLPLLHPVLLSMVEFVVVTGGVWGLSVNVAWGIAKRGRAQCSKVVRSSQGGLRVWIGSGRLKFSLRHCP